MGYLDLFSVVAKKYLSLNYFLSKEVYLAHQYSCYLTKIFSGFFRTWQKSANGACVR